MTSRIGEVAARSWRGYPGDRWMEPSEWRSGAWWRHCLGIGTILTTPTPQGGASAASTSSPLPRIRQWGTTHHQSSLPLPRPSDGARRPWPLVQTWPGRPLCFLPPLFLLSPASSITPSGTTTGGTHTLKLDPLTPTKGRKRTAVG